VSLVIAASGGTASAAPQPSAPNDNAAPTVLHDSGQALGDDDGTQDEHAVAGDAST